jgi:hypothetical protein
MLRAMQKFVVDANVIGFGIGFGSEFGDYGSIYFDVSRGNQFFGLAPRSDSGSGDDLLQTFSRHECDSNFGA